MDLTKPIHPCQKCGACCASFRVEFYWWEAEPEAVPSVPKELTEDLDLRTRCMKGSNNKHRPKCAALKGKVGAEVACSIYESRPTPCRRFSASYESGVQEPRCDEARARYGIKPLQKGDWVKAGPG